MQDPIAWDYLRHAALGGPAELARFAPRLAYGRHWGLPLPTARSAAVAVLLYPRSSGWHVLLTRRPDQATRHAGQVSFPGGLVEAGESSRQAMLRELDEEVGVPEASVEVMRPLGPVYIYATQFVMLPWLCRATGELRIRPDAREVQQVLELPVRQLRVPGAWKDYDVARGELCFSAPGLSWHGCVVWGATAIVLGQLELLLRGAGDEDVAE